MKPSDFFKYLMEERGLTIENLSELSGLSVFIINIFRTANYFNPKKDTIEKLTLAFKMSANEAEILFNSYGYTLINSWQRSDIAFIKTLARTAICNDNVLFFQEIKCLSAKEKAEHNQHKLRAEAELSQLLLFTVNLNK